MLLQSHNSRICRKSRRQSAYAIQSDHLNTPRRLIQSDGQVAWQWAYSAFGDEKPTIAKNRFANTDLNQSFGTTSVPAVTFNLRYPGQYYDAETGLHYNYHRSYSSTLGRYTQSDPIGLDGGWNRFGYVGGNPLSRIDPLGLIAWTGTYHARSLIEGVGAGWVDFVLTSDCIEGKRFRANVTGVGPGAGIGVPKVPVLGSETYGTLTVRDHNTNIDPSALSGAFGFASIGISIGTRDKSYGRVRIGKAFGNNPDHGSGLDIGATMVLGTSTVTSGVWESCDCAAK